jgi:bifunctional UDP-N-acetylglucosamine pyrophosphorylase/glucosamine-1-phosphate N-acetyltransferase
MHSAGVMQGKKIEAILLAAGEGKRMHSQTPKVLHALAGRPLLAHVLDRAEQLAPAAIHLVYGHGADRVRAQFPDIRVNWVLQAEQRGTGHAVTQAMQHVDPAATVLVLYGDVPLIQPSTLRNLLDTAQSDGVALLAVELRDPTNYGRIVRAASGRVIRIVEQKDASDQELKIAEVNTGFLAAPAHRLAKWLARLKNNNAQGEYYLTDIISLAVADGVDVVAIKPEHEWEVLGVNTNTELARLERIYQHKQAEELLQQGVTVRDPARLDVRGEVKVGRDVVIDVNVILEGKVELGDGVYIGPNNLLRDATVGANSRILANCIIEESAIGSDCRIGPYARLRPGNRIANGVHIGNFVEVKNSEIEAGSKANHLAYVGDSTVGRDVNIGAGTITANYDGANKHRTLICDNASIGSNTVLRAPVTVGAGATIGAGSVITKDAPPGELTLTRSEQRTIKGWKRPSKNSNK